MREGGQKLPVEKDDSPSGRSDRRLANLTPGGKPHEKKCRRYKVQRLPAPIQDLIASGYAQGDSFRAITAAVKAAGYAIDKDAVRRYWHAVWKDEHERLRNARLTMIALKHALQLGPGSPSGQVAEEMLYTVVCSKLKEIEEQPSLVLLHEAREQEKVSGKKSSRAPVSEEATPVEQAREVRRRWRQLYGLETADDAEEEKAKDPED